MGYTKISSIIVKTEQKKYFFDTIKTHHQASNALFLEHLSVAQGSLMLVAALDNKAVGRPFPGLWPSKVTKNEPVLQLWQ